MQTQLFGRTLQGSFDRDREVDCKGRYMYLITRIRLCFDGSLLLSVVGLVVAGRMVTFQRIIC